MQYPSRIIKIDKYDIKIVLDKYPNGECYIGGSIESKLGKTVGCKSVSNFLEALILAHAVSGIDVSSYDYMEGVDTALEAWSNHE